MPWRRRRPHLAAIRRGCGCNHSPAPDMTSAPKPAAGSAPPPQVVSRNAAPPDARREPSSSTAASTMTLAERRAAVRRRTVDAGSSPVSSSPLVAQAASATGSRSTSPHEAREIAVGGRSRQGGNEEIGDQTLRTRPMPVDPVLFERDHETSPSSDPSASAALDRGTSRRVVGRRSAGGISSERSIERTGATRGVRDTSRSRHARRRCSP